jgi:hypothetical protein
MTTTVSTDRREPIMTKATVKRLFIGSILAVTAGTIVAISAVWLAIANDIFVMDGADIVGIQGSALAWVLGTFGIAGALAVTGGLIGGLISWIGALLNTSQVESKTWFLALLVLGIFNFGFFAMIAYLIAGPDGTSAATSHRAPVTATA